VTTIENLKPKIIEGEFVIHELDDEVLVYNYDTNHAACLERSAFEIWKRCDGTQTVGDLFEAHGEFGLEQQAEQEAQTVVLNVLEKLKTANLLDEEDLPDSLLAVADSRRQFLKGAAIAGVPLVVGMPIPAAAQGASCLPNGANCTANTECCSGLCNLGSGNPKCTTGG